VQVLKCERKHIYSLTLIAPPYT